jgi:hypothetical protein
MVRDAPDGQPEAVHQTVQHQQLHHQVITCATFI